MRKIFRDFFFMSISLAFFLLIGCSIQAPPGTVVSPQKVVVKEKEVGKVTESPGYYLTDLEYVIKILNGLPYLAKVLIGKDASRHYLLKPGGQVNVPFLKSYDDRIIVMTAVFFRKKEIIGTASKAFVIPAYDSIFEEDVWHITSFRTIK